MRPGTRHTAATRRKMSAARKAAWADPAVRAKMSAARKAALADPAVRAKMSAASKAAWADPAVRAKIAAGQQAAGVALNPEQHAQIKAQIEAGATPAQIAADWLISAAYAYTLAKRLGARFLTRYERFRLWADSTTRALTPARVMGAMEVSRATAHRWLRQLAAERGETSS